MDLSEPLSGSCSCGRNRYSIVLPAHVSPEQARIYFDSSRDNCRSHAAPLTAWLRVPLGWFQSYTQSYFPDETHASIRRSFTPPHAPHTKRIFCGYCGTPLTFWTEEPREEADFMSVAIGSLSRDHQQVLEDLGLLPDELGELDEDTAAAAAVGEQPSQPREVRPSSSSMIVPRLEDTATQLRSVRSGKVAGIPWFEEIVDGSRLGRLLRTRRGFGVSDDQSTTVEWEISEWTENTEDKPLDTAASSGPTLGKRERGQDIAAEGTKGSRVRTSAPSRP